MKFIDQNSEFGTPNHNDYQGIHKTGNVPFDSDQPITLAHRWMGISQTLPHTMAAQGLQPGDQITISWNQKSDSRNKGAMVGLHHYRKSDGNPYWGASIGAHLATLEEGSLEAGEREFLQYREKVIQEYYYSCHDDSEKEKEQEDENHQSHQYYRFFRDTVIKSILLSSRSTSTMSGTIGFAPVPILRFSSSTPSV